MQVSGEIRVLFFPWYQLDGKLLFRLVANRKILPVLGMKPWLPSP
jgi:hypothetical protein